MHSNEPKPIGLLSPSDIARFWSHVDRRGPDECWPWKLGLWSNGYSRFSFNQAGKNRSVRGHRVALFLATGNDPGDLLGCHSCDNKPCCNPDHLFAGSHQQNMDDCVAKGRQATGDRQAYRLYPEIRPYGERNHFAKLSDCDAMEVIILATLGVSLETIIRRFPLCPPAMMRVINGKTFAHLPRFLKFRRVRRSGGLLPIAFRR